MDHTELQQLLSDLLPGAVFNTNPQFVEAVIPASDLHKFALELKTNSKTSFDYLVCQTGVDQNEEFRVVYHLRSTLLKHQCVIKVITSDRVNPVFDSVFDIWKTAEFFEREIFDFYGIKFNNHPDLRRLFLEDDFEGYPLRKDFVDNINIVQ
jgi:NADH-quinone oxidoreductase subunit C